MLPLRRALEFRKRSGLFYRDNHEKKNDGTDDSGRKDRPSIVGWPLFLELYAPFF